VFEAEIASTVGEIKSLLVGKSKKHQVTRKEKQVPVEALYYIALHTYRPVA
jgi:hypothetical protein